MDENQTPVADSFVALFRTPGGRLTQSRAYILERHEFCEDLAQMLVETARTRFFELGIAEQDVLHKIGEGLRTGEVCTEDTERVWVLTRLAELLGWPLDQGSATFATPLFTDR